MCFPIKIILSIRKSFIYQVDVSLVMNQNSNSNEESFKPFTAWFYYTNLEILNAEDMKRVIIFAYDDFWIDNESCLVCFTLKGLNSMHTSMSQLFHITIKICKMRRNLLNLNHAKCLSFFVIVNLQKVAWLSLIIWGITYLVCEKDWKCH